MSLYLTHYNQRFILDICFVLVESCQILYLLNYDQLVVCNQSIPGKSIIHLLARSAL